MFTTSHTRWQVEKLTQIIKSQQGTIQDDTEKIRNIEAAFGIQAELIIGLRANLASASVEHDDLRSELNAEKDRRVLAEGRVADLQESLDVERKRFDSAISHEREVTTGMRARIGLVPRPVNAEGQASSQEPIQSGRPAWRGTQRKLEEESKKLADARSAHWEARIKATEEKDKLTGISAPDENADRRTDSVEDLSAGSAAN